MLFAQLSTVCCVLLIPAPLALAAELRVPTSYERIQDAVDVAVSGDTVLVEQGSYDDDFTLADGVVVQGEETRETFLAGTVTPAGGGSLRRFTVQGAGIVCNGVHGLRLTNNVFEGIAGTAVDAEDCEDLLIQNNTFFGNTEGGVALTLSSGTVESNIFVNSGTPISLISEVDPGVTIRSNHFNDNSQVGEEGVEATEGDPFFVSAQGGDFHLQDSSNLIASVTTDGVERGAYGGAEADPIPAVVSNVSLAPGLSTDNGGTVSW